MLQFQEICCHHDIQHIVVVDLLCHLALLLVVLLLQELYDELEGLQVTGQSDLDSLVICHSIDHRSKVLYILQSPLLIEKELEVFLFATFDYNFDFLEIKWLLLLYQYI